MEQATVAIGLRTTFLINYMTSKKIFVFIALSLILTLSVSWKTLPWAGVKQIRRVRLSPGSRGVKALRSMNGPPGSKIDVDKSSSSSE